MIIIQLTLIVRVTSITLRTWLLVLQRWMQVFWSLLLQMVLCLKPNNTFFYVVKLVSTKSLYSWTRWTWLKTLKWLTWFKKNLENYLRNMNMIQVKQNSFVVLQFLPYKILILNLENQKLSNFLMLWIKLFLFLHDQLINLLWCQLRVHIILLVVVLWRRVQFSKERLKLVIKLNSMVTAVS